jgi:fluoroquinolone transport system ATP-binding protein
MTVADQLCDRVAFVVDGRIAALDSPMELKVSRRVVRVTYRTDAGHDLTTSALDGLADDEGFSTLLRTHEVATVHSQEADLEDVFLEITGRSLS